MSWRQLTMATAFLTRLPARSHNSSGQESSLLQALKFAPLVGVLVALLQTILAALLIALQLPALAVGLLVTALAVWFTRGLHEDGLSDYVDGIAGGWTVERRLEIMRDSRIGAFGTIALIITLGLRTVMIASIATIGLWHLAIALLFSATLSRAGFLVLFRFLPPARADGLSSSLGRPDTKSLTIALLLPLLIAVLLYPPVALAAFALWAVAMAILIRQARNAIGGHTGDVAGAAQQLGEIAILLVLAMGIWQ